VAGLAGAIISAANGLLSGERIQALQDEVTGRQISPTQREELQRGLAPLRWQKVAVYADGEDTEAEAYAHQLFDVLSAAGIDTGQGVAVVWPTDIPPPLQVLHYYTLPFNGYSADDQEALAIRKVFVDANLLPENADVIEEAQSNSTGTDLVRVEVGPRG